MLTEDFVKPNERRGCGVTSDEGAALALDVVNENGEVRGWGVAWGTELDIGLASSARPRSFVRLRIGLRIRKSVNVNKALR